MAQFAQYSVKYAGVSATCTRRILTNLSHVTSHCFLNEGINLQ